MHLNEPVVRRERFADGGTRRGRLIGDLAPDDTAPAHEPHPEGGASDSRALLVRDLRVRAADGGGGADVLAFSDEAAREPRLAMFAESHPDADTAAVRGWFCRKVAPEGEEGGLDVVADHARLAERVIAARAVQAGDDGRIALEPAVVTP